MIFPSRNSVRILLLIPLAPVGYFVSVNIKRALREGIDRTFSRNGGLLIVIWAVVATASITVFNSWFLSVFSSLPSQPMLIGPSLDLPSTVAGVSTLVLYLVSFVVMAGALRIFVTDNRFDLPRAAFTRNIGPVLGNLILGYIAFFIAIWTGYLLLIIPGIFLTVSLFFWFVMVVVEDVNFITAFKESWALTRGNRWSLLGLGMAVTVVGWLAMMVPVTLTFLIPSMVAWLLLGLAVSVYGVFSIATAARVYVQLTMDGQGQTDRADIVG